MRRTTPLIVGGGPAGAAAAIRLAELGMPPLVVERSVEPPDMLCGGFLSWATVTRLRAIGVDPFALGASPINRLRIFSAGRETVVRLPDVAAGLSRLRLDEALLARAAAAGAQVERGCAVRAIEERQARLADGRTIDAGPVILATGKHDLRGVKRDMPDGTNMLGLRWRLRAGDALDRRIADSIELHLFDGGYAGLLRQETHVNLCLAVTMEAFDAAGGTPNRLLARLGADLPALAERLTLAEDISAPRAIANIPYGWRATRSGNGAFRVGDQCAVIPSLAGEGIAIALASGVAAAEAVVAGVAADRFQRDFARRARRPLWVAGGLWRLMEAPRSARWAITAMRIAPPLFGLAARASRI